MIDHDGAYRPGRLVPEARRALRGLDGASPSAAATRLTEAARVLLQLVEEARYPRWAVGVEEPDYYRNEAEELVSNVNDERVLSLPPRALYRRCRQAVDALTGPVAALGSDFDVVARNGYRRQVDAAKVEAVTGPAGDIALLCALLAVELDPAVVSGW